MRRGHACAMPACARMRNTGRMHPTPCPVLPQAAAPIASVGFLLLFHLFFFAVLGIRCDGAQPALQHAWPARVCAAPAIPAPNNPCNAWRYATMPAHAAHQPMQRYGTPCSLFGPSYHKACTEPGGSLPMELTMGDDADIFGCGEWRSCPANLTCSVRGPVCVFSCAP
jgi:hypothetical protein